MPYHEETIMGDLKVGGGARLNIGNNTRDFYIPGPQASSNRQTGDGQTAMGSASPSQIDDLHAAQAARRDAQSTAQTAQQNTQHAAQAARRHARQAEQAAQHAERDAQRRALEAERATNETRPHPATRGGTDPSSEPPGSRGQSRPDAEYLLGFEVGATISNHAWGVGDLYGARSGPNGVQWDRETSTAPYIGPFRRNRITRQMVSLVSCVSRPRLISRYL
jgi:hypothetical protein